MAVMEALGAFFERIGQPNPPSSSENGFYSKPVVHYVDGVRFKDINGELRCCFKLKELYTQLQKANLLAEWKDLLKKSNLGSFSLASYDQSFTSFLKATFNLPGSFIRIRGFSESRLQTAVLLLPVGFDTSRTLASLLLFLWQNTPCEPAAKRVKKVSGERFVVPPSSIDLWPYCFPEGS